MGSGGRLLLLGTALLGVMALALFSVIGGGMTEAAGQADINVSGTSTTLASVSPLDVVSVSTTLANGGTAAQRLGVVMLIRDGTGKTLLRETQSGISLPDGSNLSVYWEWRIPGRLADGCYTVEMSAVDEGGKVLAVDANPAVLRIARTSAQQTGGL